MKTQINHIICELAKSFAANVSACTVGHEAVSLFNNNYQGSAIAMGLVSAMMGVRSLQTGTIIVKILDKKTNSILRDEKKHLFRQKFFLKHSSPN